LDGARRAVPDHRAGGIEAPEGARARGPDHPRSVGAAPSRAPDRRAVARRDGVAREVPSAVGRELRPPRGAHPEVEMTQAGITIRRVFAAPRERVWREWTEPECFADWFGGGAEVPL